MNVSPTLGRREAKRLATWRAIRHAAIELTDELGWDAVSIDAVAERADVSSRTVFNYFGTRDALLFAPDPETAHRNSALIDSLDTGTSLWAALETVVTAILADNAAKMATVARVLHDEPALFQSASTHYAGLQHDLAEILSRRLPADAPAVAPLAASAAAVGVMSSAIAIWDPTDGVDALEVLVRQGFAATAADRADLTLQSPISNETETS